MASRRYKRRMSNVLFIVASAVGLAAIAVRIARLMGRAAPSMKKL
jgi:hypothetical protein